MPPRQKRLAVRRRGAQSGPPEPSPPPSSDSDSSGGNGMPPPSLARSPSLLDRQITTGRNVDFRFFDSEGFRIGTWIRNQGWQSFFSMSQPTYPRLVRQFYQTMTRGDGDLGCTVKGVSFVITPESLGEIWSLPAAGIAPPHPVDRELALRIITGLTDVSTISRLEANSLSIEMRVLSHIIARIIYPKTGRFDLIPDRVIGIMDCIVRGQLLNLPLLIFRQMRDSIGRHRACLPYGMALTSLFREVGVDLEGELTVTLRHTDTYGEKTLIRMGYRRIDGRWTRRVSGQEQQRERHVPPPPTHDEAGPSQPAESSPPPPQPAEPAPEQHDDPFSTPPAHSTRVDPPSVEDQVERITEAVVERLRPQLESIRGEMSGIAEEIRGVAGILLDRSSSSSSMITSLLSSIGQLLDMIRSYAPADTFAEEQVAREAAEAVARATATAAEVEADELASAAARAARDATDIPSDSAPPPSTDEPIADPVPPPSTDTPSADLAPPSTDAPPSDVAPLRPLRTYVRSGPATRTRSRKIFASTSSASVDISD